MEKSSPFQTPDSDGRISGTRTRPWTWFSSCVDLTLQGTQADPHQVGQDRVLEVEGCRTAPRAAAGDDLSGHPDHHRVGRDVVDDHGVGPDPAPAPDRDGPEHLGPGPDRHPVPHRRVALAGLE